MNILKRHRRLRTSQTLRKLVRETKISPNSFILPVFVQDGTNIFEEIESLEGQFRYSVDKLEILVEKCKNGNVDKIILFGIPEKKDEIASSAYDENGIIQRAIKRLKELWPEIYIITDICMCEYTSNGHCGIVNSDGYVDNDKTVEIIGKIALSHAKAGADMVAPSDMMDGRIGFIRKILDENDFVNVPIMAYSAKYASAFYGPFRDAAGSAPSFGDRKSYQMDCHNFKEALSECQSDIDEGADIIMIKPALSYLDVVKKADEMFNVPICVYSVSGEYAMIKAGGKAGLIDEYSVMCESAVSMFRAGADMIITYFALELSEAVLKGDIG